MQKEWLGIITWSVISGGVGFFLMGMTPAGTLVIVGISFVFALLGGMFRYFFIPVGRGDIFAALTDLEWRTEQEILETVIQEKRIAKTRSNRITVVSFIWGTLTKMERGGYVVSRPRYDPSGLRCSIPEIEYRLTAQGIHQRICETDEKNQPTLRHRIA